ncbi:MAG: methionine--tRNA ligase [Chloroflexota bacterium]|nr:methionine--tRNA ligase [Chloroflexota bacterium]NOG65244.1 methionine--tRNA ligase [Chloroflexota bacterium]GIK66631.1 MAG: methionine--tRNA ligase [Chloroflexota bacterium]
MSDFIHVSVAWPYVNGDLHAGHIAGSFLPADIFARYHRLKGNHTLMVSGSDTHGTPIMVEADAQGITPRELFEKYHVRFLDTLKRSGMSFDLYTHTDTENHHRVAQDIFTLLLERGYLYPEEQERLYSTTENRFLEDRYVEGTCPVCGYENARGDQCDNCGNLLNATDLINPRSKRDGSTPVRRSTTHYFFDLGKFREPLTEYLEKGRDHWRENVLNESLSKVPEQRGRPMTRDVNWGIKVPIDDPAWSEKRLYVWFEALMGYFTASIEWAHNNGQPDAWKQWWYNPQARVYNFLGKDNIIFHTIIWPAELLGISGIYNEGDPTPINLPYDVPANQYLNLEERKLSKSRKWFITMPDLLDAYDPDAVRYYLTVVMPENRDSDWKWDDFVARNNNELLAKWGNLVNRVLKFAYKHWEGVVPTPGDLRDFDREILAKIEAGFESVGQRLEAVKLRDALSEAMRLASEVNAYLDGAPWFGDAIKQDKQAAATTIYTALRCIDNLKILFAPFLPFTSEKVHSYLGYDAPLFGEQIITEYQETTQSHQALIYDGSRAVGRWEKSTLQPGQKLREPEALIKKLDVSVVEAERAKLGG